MDGTVLVADDDRTSRTVRRALVWKSSRNSAGGGMRKADKEALGSPQARPRAASVPYLATSQDRKRSVKSGE